MPCKTRPSKDSKSKPNMNNDTINNIIYALQNNLFCKPKIKIKKKHFPAQYCSIKRPELPFLQYQKLCRSMLARSPIYNLGLDALIYFGVFLRLLIKFYPPKSVTLCKESINELFVGNQIQLRKKWLGTI